MDLSFARSPGMKMTKLVQYRTIIGNNLMPPFFLISPNTLLASPIFMFDVCGIDIAIRSCLWRFFSKDYQKKRRQLYKVQWNLFNTTKELVMGHFRFWRRFMILPFVYLNISKSGLSFSFGPRGAKYTIGSRGRRMTLGIPGTGLFYTIFRKKNRKHSV